jgi:hypothetical protein
MSGKTISSEEYDELWDTHEKNRELNAKVADLEKKLAVAVRYA